MKRGGLVELAVIAVLAVGAALLVQAFVVKPYRVPTPSMADTLRPGDRVLVNRFVYRLHPPGRGDVLVFKYPLNERVVFVKRVVALPGETVSLRDGKVLVDGSRLPEPYLTSAAGSVATLPGGFVERTTMARPWSLRAPYTVPAGSYFVMGDNRDDSDDSRSWGLVPARDIIGEAFAVYWPVGRWHGL